jgi:hypothetical protein
MSIVDWDDQCQLNISMIKTRLFPYEVIRSISECAACGISDFFPLVARLDFVGKARPYLCSKVTTTVVGIVHEPRCSGNLADFHRFTGSHPSACANRYPGKML